MATVTDLRLYSVYFYSLTINMLRAKAMKPLKKIRCHRLCPETLLLHL